LCSKAFFLLDLRAEFVGPGGEDPGEVDRQVDGGVGDAGPPGRLLAERGPPEGRVLFGLLMLHLPN
jgi:hypothetical protein